MNQTDKRKRLLKKKGNVIAFRPRRFSGFVPVGVQGRAICGHRCAGESNLGSSVCKGEQSVAIGVQGRAIWGRRHQEVRGGTRGITTRGWSRLTVIIKVRHPHPLLTSVRLGPGSGVGVRGGRGAVLSP